MSRLIAVEYLDRSGNYAYAPPTREGVINTDEIVSVKVLDPYVTRSSYEVVRIRFRDGSTIDVIGKPSDFADPEPTP